MLRHRVVIWVSARMVICSLLACALGVLVLVAVPRVRETFVPLTEIVSGKTIFIDPGHGGRDPGCVSSAGLTEKELVLDLGLRLRDLFLRSAINAELTREEDSEVWPAGTIGWKRSELDNRINLANEARADIFISIHANSFPESIWSGAQTFYYPGQEDSKALAISIQNSLVTKLGPNRRKAKAGDFWVLSKAEMPAAMVEVGFLSNPREAELLSTDQYRDQVAQAIFEGVIQYLVESKTKQRSPLGEPEKQVSSRSWATLQRDEVVLYFIGPNNQDDCLVAEVRQIPQLAEAEKLSSAEVLKLTLAELCKGPGPGSILHPLIPAGIKIEDVQVDAEAITVILNNEVEQVFRGGGHSEELVVYGIVNTISELFPNQQVYLRVGAESDTSIGGHVWLGRPLYRREELISPK